MRDKTYQTVSGATVQTTIDRPDGGSDTLNMKPDPLEPGTYTGDYTADKPGAYVAEIVGARQDKTELGRDTLTFRREDGVAENFNAAQNQRSAREAVERYRRELLHAVQCEEAGRMRVAVSEAGHYRRTTTWISGTCRFCFCW